MNLRARKILQTLIQASLALMVFISAVFGLGVSTFQLDVAAQFAEYDLIEYNELGRGEKARIVVDKQGRFLGLSNCFHNSPGFNNSVGDDPDIINAADNSCQKFLPNVNVGDIVRSQRDIKINYDLDNNGVTVGNRGIAAYYNDDLTETRYVLQADNGNSYSLTDQERIQMMSECGAGRLASPASCDFLVNLANEKASQLRNFPSGRQIATGQRIALSVEEYEALAESLDIADQFSTDGVQCTSALDPEGNAVLSCLKEGEPVDQNGNALACNEGDEIKYFYLDESAEGEDIRCVDSNTARNIAAIASTNNELGNITSSADTNPASAANNGLEALGKILYNIVTFIVLLLLVLIGWLVQLVFWLVSSVTLVFLSINPAGANFFQVALEPWGVMVTIANILLVAGFVFLGFNYILGNKQSMRVDQFITNVVIVGVTLNFTIFACAAVINIGQGVGDVFLSGYSAATGETRQDALFGTLVDGISEVSYLRCGTLEATEDAFDCGETRGDLRESTGANIATVGANVVEVAFSGKTGAQTAAMFAEVIFIIAVGYAVVIMWRAMVVALIRIVGLWLLMIVSPIAVVGFFSPIPALKKQTQAWGQKFTELVLFYPVFIIGLVMIGRMAGAFGEASKVQIANLQNNSAGSILGPFVNVEAQSGTSEIETAVLSILSLLLVAGVAVGGLKILLDFMEKTFGTITNSVLGWAGKAISGAASLGRLGFRAAGGAAALAGRKVSQAGDATNLKSRRDRISNVMDRLAARQGGVQRLTGENLKRYNRLKLDKDKLNIAIKSKNRIANIGDRLNKTGSFLGNVGDAVEYLPEQIMSGGALKDIYQNMALRKKARSASMKSLYKFRRELGLRKAGLGDLVEGPDSVLPGMDAKEARELYKDKEKRAQYERQISSRAYSSVASSPKVGRNRAVNALLSRGNASQGDPNKLNNKQFDQNRELLDEVIDSPSSMNQLLQDANTRKMIGYMTDNDLLSEDTAEKLRSIYPSASSDQQELIRAAVLAATDEDSYRKMSSLNFNNETFARAFLNESTKSMGSQKAREKLLAKTGSSYGTSQSGALKAQSDVWSSLQSNGVKPTSTLGKNVQSAMSFTSGKGQIDESMVVNTLIESGQDINYANTQRILDSQAQNLFGTNTMEGVDRMTIDQIKATHVGAEIHDHVTSTMQITDPGEIDTIVRSALKAGVGDYKYTQPAFNELVQAESLAHKRTKQAYISESGPAEVARSQAKYLAQKITDYGNIRPDEFRAIAADNVTAKIGESIAGVRASSAAIKVPSASQGQVELDFTRASTEGRQEIAQKIREFEGLIQQRDTLDSRGTLDAATQNELESQYRAIKNELITKYSDVSGVSGYFDDDVQDGIMGKVESMSQTIYNGVENQTDRAAMAEELRRLEQLASKRKSSTEKKYKIENKGTIVPIDDILNGL